MKKGVPSVYLVWRVSLDLGLPGDGVVLYPSLSSPEGSSSAHCCVPAQSQPTAVTGHQCPSSTALA